MSAEPLALWGGFALGVPALPHNAKGTSMITIDLWFFITLIASALAVFDAITRLRGKNSNSILAILELIFGGLLLLSLFVAIPIGTALVALILLIVLLVLVFLPGRGGRNARTITIIAAVLTAVIVLVNAGWLDIPGL